MKDKKKGSSPAVPKPKKGGRQSRNRRTTNAPLAVGHNYSSYANISGSGPTTNLRYREIFPVYTGSDGATLIPMCPTKWSNTRTAALAATYTAHRPLECRLDWVPSVSAATDGAVAIGTVFDGARLKLGGDFVTDARVLSSTNGGFMSSIWHQHGSNVSLARNLRANTFPLYEVSDDDIPFWICFICSNTEGSKYIGDIVLTGRTTLRNPIVNVQAAPVNWSGTATFEHSEDSTTMKLSPDLNIPAGQSLDFVFGKSLVNTTGSVLYDMLSAVTATRGSDGTGVFTVNPLLQSQKALGAVIGLSQNF